MRKNLAGVIAGILVLILAACTTASAGSPTATEGTPPAAALEAQRWLAGQMARDVKTVEIVAVEQAEWPDSCLGLGQAHEACLTVITPGWRVVLRVDRQDYEVRTDATGSVVRLNAPAASADLAGTEWQLVSYGPAEAPTPVAAGSTVTLTFGPDGQAGGEGGCNAYGAAYQEEGGRVQFDEIVSTLRLCADEAVMDQEAAYFEALRTASRYDVSGGTLTLAYEGGVLTFAAAGQAGPPAPDVSTPEARLPGIVDFFGDGSEGVLNAPESAQAGQEFQVTIATFGGGCERAGEIEALVFADGAALFVYDFTAAIGPEVACPAILQRFEHTVTLRFDEAGEKNIRVWGRRVGPETRAEGAPVVLEHTLVVR